MSEWGGSEDLLSLTRSRGQIEKNPGEQSDDEAASGRAHNTGRRNGGTKRRRESASLEPPL